MTCSTDLEFARALQEQLDKESAENLVMTATEHSVSPPRKESGDNVYSGYVDKPLSIVDERWELIDPNPDIRALFLEFNDQYFWGKLAGVEVKWSPRMTLCAGLCCYEGRGGLCSVRLSLPLLKLRPRKDLVETLLHEMIHALLFVTQNNKDHDSHGPEFHKHMYRINQATGTNISVYHTFHDEVDSYRQHWWRCNGPCQKRKPYFGIVRRAMNRAPSPRDPWWGEHQRSCGGTYTKIKEPEGYGNKSKGKKKESGPESTSKDARSADIRNLFSPKKPSHTITNATHTDIKDTERQPQDDITSSTSSSYTGTGYVLGGSSSGVSRLIDRTLNFNKENHTSSQKGKTLKVRKPIPSPITCFSDSSSDEEFLPIKRKIKNADDSESKRPRLDKDIINSNKDIKKLTSSVDSQIVNKHNNPSGSGSILHAFDRQRRVLENSHRKMTVSAQHDNNDDAIISSITFKPVISGNSTNKVSISGENNEGVSCPVCATRILSSKINEHLDLCLG
ncbi:DNA-dependent metalloprotease SPRTN-like [Glandiceps talaboti]